ncbi:hypothetical protein KHA80_05110 [Anaerobacillus sp. HL2]|nr:hypothetical protein KHA80_05110 [Anaerobacillus sp. HL2]
MSHILKQTFIKITRQMSSIEQLIIEEEYEFILFEKRLYLHLKHFSLKIFSIVHIENT